MAQFLITLRCLQQQSGEMRFGQDWVLQLVRPDPNMEKGIRPHPSWRLVAQALWKIFHTPKLDGQEESSICN